MISIKKKKASPMGTVQTGQLGDDIGTIETVKPSGWAGTQAIAKLRAAKKGVSQAQKSPKGEVELGETEVSHKREEYSERLKKRGK